MTRRAHQPITTAEGWAFQAWLDAETSAAPVPADVRLFADFAASVLRRARLRLQAALLREELHRRRSEPAVAALLDAARADADAGVRAAEELAREPFIRLHRAQLAYLAAHGHSWLDEEIQLGPAGRALVAQEEQDADWARARDVKPLRKRFGLTQAQAAVRMGLARTSVVAIEAGHRRCSASELAALEGGAS